MRFNVPKVDFVNAAVEIGVDPLLAHQAYAQLISGDILLLAVNGKLAAGKDTIAPAVLERLGISNVVHIYYATALKDEVDKAIEIIYNTDSVRDAISLISNELAVKKEDAAFVVGSLWTMRSLEQRFSARSRTPEIRSVLQFWGTEVRRSVDPLYWVKKTLISAIEAIAAGKSVYATDVRFMNEVEWARKLGFFVVRLDVTPETQKERLLARDGIVADASSLNHPSETNLDGYLGFDLIVDNNGSVDQTVDIIADKLS